MDVPRRTELGRKLEKRAGHEAAVSEAALSVSGRAARMSLVLDVRALDEIQRDEDRTDDAERAWQRARVG